VLIKNFEIDIFLLEKSVSEIGVSVVNSPFSLNLKVLGEDGITETTGGRGTRTETGMTMGTTGTTGAGAGVVGGGAVVIMCGGVLHITAMGENFFELFGDGGVGVGVMTGFFGVREASLTGDCRQEDPEKVLVFFLLLIDPEGWLKRSK
jgi:hypothetical protein